MDERGFESLPVHYFNNNGEMKTISNANYATAVEIVQAYIDIKGGGSGDLRTVNRVRRAHVLLRSLKRNVR